MQEKVRSRELELFKVLGSKNPADVLTKHVPRETLDHHLRLGFRHILLASPEPIAQVEVGW